MLQLFVGSLVIHHIVSKFGLEYIDDRHIWSNYTTGATTSIGMEFGQGEGPRWMENVQCDPTRNRTLLECDHVGASYLSCRHHDAAVLCLDEQVRNIAVNTVFCHSLHNLY